MCIDFTLTDGTKSYLSYSSFKVGPASSNYRLNISGYNGIFANDPIAGSYSLNGMPFTTKDKDNDKWDKNCAVNDVGNAGGWWYYKCSNIFINHQYKNKHCALWFSGWKVFSFTEIKIRPVNYSM